MIINALYYENGPNLFNSNIYMQNAKNNPKILLLLLKKCRCETSSYIEIKNIEELETKLNMTLTNVDKSVINTNLRVSSIHGLVLVIESVDLIQSNNLYTIKCRALSGTQISVLNNEKSITFNSLSIKIREEFKLYDIVFAINEECFDLGDFNKKCIPHFTTLMNK